MGLSSLDLRVSHTICRVSIAESLRTQLPHPIFCRLCPHTWIQQAGCLISESHDCLPLNLSSKSSPKPSGLCPPLAPPCGLLCYRCGGLLALTVPLSPSPPHIRLALTSGETSLGASPRYNLEPAHSSLSTLSQGGSNVSKELLGTGPWRPEWSSVASYLQPAFRPTPVGIEARPVCTYYRNQAEPARASPKGKGCS